MTVQQLLARPGFGGAPLRSKWVRRFLLLFIALELFNHGFIPAYLATKKGIETRAIADNAALKQRAEAELSEWKAITETAIADYAERKQRAEARKATADAGKVDAESIVARETARNSELKTRAEAEAQAFESELKNQEALAETEAARQAVRRKRAEADLVAEEALTQQYGASAMQRLGQ